MYRHSYEDEAYRVPSGSELAEQVEEAAACGGSVYVACNRAEIWLCDGTDIILYRAKIKLEELSRPETTENDQLATSAQRLKARAKALLSNSRMGAEQRQLRVAKKIMQENAEMLKALLAKK